MVVAFALILVILTIWPRPYHASALLAPDDSAAGLTGLFSGGGGVNLVASLLGGRGTIEADLLIGRSHAVFGALARRLHDEGHYRGVSLEVLETRLRHKIDVESVRASILQISVDDHDPALARQIVEDFVLVLRQRLTDLSREQAIDKRVIARERMDYATVSLNHEQQLLNAYRAAHHFSGPDVQLGFSQGAEVGLQAQLEGAQSTLLTLEKVEGPDNIQVQAVKDKIGILQKQIADIQSRGGAGSIQSLSQLNPELTQYLNLYRDEQFAEIQYEIYKRYLESLEVQEAAAPLNMDIIDPPFLDPQRHFNAVPLGLLSLLIIIAFVAEFYIPTYVRRAV